MKSFNVPLQYRSPLINAIKQKRKQEDKLKKDYRPTLLKAGPVELLLARHFGFCYGVENAIEIAFNAVAQNKGKNIYLLSEMIHNPGVNADLEALGVKFITDTQGQQLIPWDSIDSNDIVIVPAFGTTLELEKLLREKGIEPTMYETTCPFVEKVWNKAEKIGTDGYTVIVHGKPRHEETRATFSHSKAHTPTLVVKDMQQAQLLAQYISRELPIEQFYSDFKDQYSQGFDAEKHLKRIGVVNQTTMLATETQGIADYLKQKILRYYNASESDADLYFADTRDTLCYATNDNQSAVQGMLAEQADLAIVVGGYNSSNTSHLVELCELKLPTFFIKNEYCLLSKSEIRHYDLHKQEEISSVNWLGEPITKRILITSGASCPDALVERVIERLLELCNMPDAFAQLQAAWL
jgi:4-hydroxy-3-methylbut-2-enyl diphosphate reductase